jgi:ankyrin repeat protein
VLLRAGADPNQKADEGVTALHLAVVRDRKDLVTLLLASGADPSATDSRGASPLAWAEAQGRSEIAALLRRSQPPGVSPRSQRGSPGILGAAPTTLPATNIAARRSTTQPAPKAHTLEPQKSVTLRLVESRPVAFS